MGHHNCSVRTVRFLVDSDSENVRKTQYVRKMKVAYPGENKECQYEYKQVSKVGDDEELYQMP